MTVRPGLGPTLPELLRERLGLPAWVTAAAVVLLVSAGLLGVLTRGGAGGRADVVHRGTPAFNLLYEEELVRPAPPQGDELARLEARPRRAGARVTVRAVPDSDLRFGALPLYAERHLDALRAELGDPRVRAEGKARIWGHPGYRVDYSTREVSGRDVLLFPDDTGLRGGAVVSFRLERARGRRGGRSARAVAEVRRVMRSFQFGAERR